MRHSGERVWVVAVFVEPNRLQICWSQQCNELMCMGVPNHCTFLRSLPLWSCVSPFQITVRLLLQSLLPLLLITTHTYTTTILILLYILPLYYHYYTTITITTHFTSYYFLLVLISTYSLAKLYSNYTIMAGLIGPTV